MLRSDNASPARTIFRFGLIGCLAILLTNVWIPAPMAAGATPQPVGASGLPLPRFVSLKSGRVNMRIGPGRDYSVRWLYVRRGLPMEVIQEFDNWRKVRDPEGHEGWVLHSLLSGERTALIAPWDDVGKMLPLHGNPDADAAIVARAEPGVIVRVKACEQDWCRLEAGGVGGFVQAKRLWGVYPGEHF